MIQAFKKYAVLTDVIDRCNQAVLDTLSRHTIQEASIAIESFNNGGKRLRPALCLAAGELVVAVQERFGVSVHPRSVKRALQRREKKRR